MSPPSLQKTVEIVQGSWQKIVRKQRLKTRNFIGFLSDNCSSRCVLTPVVHRGGRPGRRRRVDGHRRSRRGSRPRRADARVRRRTLPSQVDAGVTHEAAGIILFKHIFRIAPQALPLFSFGRVEGAAVNDALFEDEALKAHATKVVATVATGVEIKFQAPTHRRALAHRSRRPSAC